MVCYDPAMRPSLRFTAPDTLAPALFVAVALAACAEGQPTPSDTSSSDVQSDITQPEDTARADDVATGDDVTTEDDASSAMDANAMTDASTDSAVVDAAGDAGMTGSDAATVTTNFQNGVAPTAAYVGTTDAYQGASTRTTNHGTDITLWADGDIPAGSLATKVSLIRWDVTAIPAGSVVRSATITLTLSTVANSPSTDRFSLYAMLRGWNESETNWNDTMAAAPWATPGAAELGRDHAVREIGGVGPLATGSQAVRLNADGVALVQQWVNSPDMNFGVQISNWISNDGLGLAASESTVTAARPRLSVAYVPR